MKTAVKVKAEYQITFTMDELASLYEVLTTRTADWSDRDRAFFGFITDTISQMKAAAIDALDQASTEIEGLCCFPLSHERSE